MKLFTCDNFRGHYAIGTSAVILAKDEGEALAMLLLTCEEIGIPQSQEDKANIVLYQVPQTQPRCIILNDGNYR